MADVADGSQSSGLSEGAALNGAKTAVLINRLADHSAQFYETYIQIRGVLRELYVLELQSTLLQVPDCA